MLTTARVEAHDVQLPHCGILYHLPDGSADAIPASYYHDRFLPDTRAALPLGRPLQGRSSLGKAVALVVDSASAPDEPFASQYHVTVKSSKQLDSTETVLFCEPPLSITIWPTKPVTLDSTAARAIRSRISVLHDSALAYDPEVLQHDSLGYGAPTVLGSVAAPAIRIVTYRITLKGVVQSDSDDRASGFAIYSATSKQVLYATFGHPEWAPTAATVTMVYPSLFFSLRGDRRLYLLAVYYGSWEAGAGQWVIFDARAGDPITAPDLAKGGRFR